MDNNKAQAIWNKIDSVDNAKDLADMRSQLLSSKENEQSSTMSQTQYTQQEYETAISQTNDKEQLAALKENLLTQQDDSQSDGQSQSGRMSMGGVEPDCEEEKVLQKTR